MYKHRYKHGKQKTIMPLAAFEAAMQDAVNEGFPLNWLAFVVLLWHTGVRKSEAYERLLADVTVTKNFVIVDFHARKKHGDEVPPLKIPREFYGVNEFLVPWIMQRQESKPPHRETWKTFYFQVDTGKYRQTKPSGAFPKGKRVTIKKTENEKRRGLWLFPHIGHYTAWKLVKKILGEEYYPHYLRLRKISRVASNPKTKSLGHLKSLTGIKSIETLQAYLGTSQETQDEAMQENE